MRAYLVVKYSFKNNNLGGGGGGGVGVTTYIYDLVRMCGLNSPFFNRKVYNKPPFSKKKYLTDPVFHHCCILTSLFENTHFIAQIFRSENQNCNIYL